ncbi:MAG: hypothetical protein HY719_00465 [Planctomycetes bacterium]|nr:hypothetical protein [Planctomycetota bacterium]
MIPPKLCTLLICDAVAQAPYGRRTLYGVFHHLAVAGNFPMVYGPAAVYVVLGFGTGKHEVQIELVDGGDHRVFALPEACPVTLESPLARAELVLSIQNLAFPAAGTYFLRVYIDGRKEEYEHMIFVDAHRTGDVPGKPAPAAG